MGKILQKGDVVTSFLVHLKEFGPPCICYELPMTFYYFLEFH